MELMFVDSPLKIPGCRLIIGLLYKYLQQCKKVLLIHSWVFMDTFETDYRKNTHHQFAGFVPLILQNKLKTLSLFTFPH